MFSTIVYSVLLAFALSDFGGSGLAVVELQADRKKCNNKIDECLNKGELKDGMAPADACRIPLERAQCLSEMVQNDVGDNKLCDQELFDASIKGDDVYVVPSNACPCCGEARTAISKVGKGTLKTTDKTDCPAPPTDICMLCTAKVAEANASFNGADTCVKLTDALNKAKTEGPGKCSEDELKKFLKPQKFVIKNAADCHQQECIDLDGQLRGNYSLALKVQNGSTEATECHDEGSAAFRIGSAIAPLLGALGTVLITFKIL